jgi:succinate dehydrogenase / fumarate reductase flavoprotein subunit
MSESLRNDGRIWVPKATDDARAAHDIPEEDRDYYLERLYPSFGNLAPRDISSRAAKRSIDQGRGVGALKNGVYLDFSESISRLGEATVRERYGNLFEMYERITDENPYKMPMRIYPAVHYTMGGLWVDYELQTTVPGLFAAGEANFSDHGANRLGASALMQGLADGYFVLPYTLANYLAPRLGQKPVDTNHQAFKQAEDEARNRFGAYLNVKGTRSVDYFHRELGKLVWDYCGMERTHEGLVQAQGEIAALHGEFKTDVRVLGSAETLNQSLEKAARVDDFFELALAMCRDADDRNESCGGHFRAEYQTEEGEALRNDDDFCSVSAWQYTGDPSNPQKHVEQLTFENVKLATRSYK